MSGVDMKWKYVKNDDWETPIEYWEILTPFISPDKTIYDPFYMNGNARRKWNHLGYGCIHKDEDFFQVEKPVGNILIVSNPPYSRRNEVLKRLFEWNKPFIMLMPITTLCYIKTQKILKDYKIQVIIPNIYKGFIDKKGNPTKCPPFYLCYICYKMNLEKDIIHLN
jgi:hypothetical protein